MWHRIFGSICIILPVHVLLNFDLGFFVLLLLRNAFFCQKFPFLSDLYIEYCLVHLGIY